MTGTNINAMKKSDIMVQIVQQHNKPSYSVLKKKTKKQLLSIYYS